MLLLYWRTRFLFLLLTANRQMWLLLLYFSFARRVLIYFSNRKNIVYEKKKHMRLHSLDGPHRYDVFDVDG